MGNSNDALTNLETKKQTRAVEMATSAIVAADLIDFSAIFAMHAFEVAKILFEQIARFIMLPFAAACTVGKAGLSWRSAYLKKWEAHATTKAIADTMSAGMITTAVVCGLALGTSFGLGGPALFAASFGVGLIFNIGWACAYTHRARTAANPQERMENTEKAQNAWLGAFICALGVAAVVTVVIFGYMPLAILGVVAGTVGATAAILHFNKLARTKPTAPVAAAAASALSSEAMMQRSLDAKLQAIWI